MMKPKNEDGDVPKGKKIPAAAHTLGKVTIAGTAGNWTMKTAGIIPATVGGETSTTSGFMKAAGTNRAGANGIIKGAATTGEASTRAGMWTGSMVRINPVCTVTAGMPVPAGVTATAETSGAVWTVTTAGADSTPLQQGIRGAGRS